MPEEPTSGVIHDIGYRHYDGPRESNTRIAANLYLTGLRHAYGLGLSGRSKLMPMLLLAATTSPAVVMVAVIAMLDLGAPPVTYAELTHSTQLLTTVFMAAQAPVLFSRDLRYRSIVLHMARPLSSRVFVLCRWAALASAGLVFVAVPQLVLLLGSLLAGADAAGELEDFARGLPAMLIACVLLASLTGLVASVALRRGFAVVGSVLLLAVSDFIVTPLQYLASDAGNDDVGVALGLFSPWRIINGLGEAFGAGVNAVTPPEGTGWILLYVVVALAVSALCVVLTSLRFAKAGRR
jgi:ABC-2 type transport system permease protein